MHVPTEKLVLDYILDNTHERKVLFDWAKEINHCLPEPKRMTRIKIANMIGLMDRRGEVILKREVSNGNIFYEFGDILPPQK